MDRKYVVPSMQWADIVIPFSSENPASIRIVSDCIKASMSKNESAEKKKKNK
jgi:uridine kinase